MSADDFSESLRKAMWERSVLTVSLRPSMLSLRVAVIAVLLHAWPGGVLSEETSRDVTLATGDLWGSLEPLIEYRPLPTIEWMPLLSDGSIDDVWLRRGSSEQSSCPHKQAEGSVAAIGHQGVKC
jgi:hypothetical protein